MSAWNTQQTTSSDYPSPPSSYTSEALPAYQSNNPFIAGAQDLPLSQASIVSPLQVHGFPAGIDSENPPRIGPRYRKIRHLSMVTTLIMIRCILPVYYRVYSGDNALEVKNHVDPNDPFLGRVLAIRIPPSHSAAHLKRHLSKQENIPEDKHIEFYGNLACRAPLKDTDHVDIIDPVGAGSTPGDPIALVILIAPKSQPETSASSTSPRSLAQSSSPSLPSYLGGFRRRYGYDYVLRTLDDKGHVLNGQLSFDLIWIVSPETGWRNYLAFRKGETLYTDGRPVQGKASPNQAPCI
jgi:hypothetical protein